MSSCWGPLLNKISWHACIEYIEMQTAQQSTLNKHSHFHMAVFLTLCDKALLLQVSWGLLPEWMLDGTVYINVWNRHLIPIPTPIPITTIPTPIPIPITTIPTPIPTPPKRTTNYSDSDSDSGIGSGIVVWFRLRSQNRPRSAIFILKQTIWQQGSAREEIWRCTRKCNVPENYVKLIQDIVLRLSNQGVRVAGGESNMFNVDVGLHQWSAFSPYLFLIHMDVLTDVWGNNVTSVMILNRIFRSVRHSDRK